MDLTLALIHRSPSVVSHDTGAALHLALDPT